MTEYKKWCVEEMAVCYCKQIHFSKTKCLVTKLIGTGNQSLEGTERMTVTTYT